MNLEDKKILITGGRGFLGSWTVDALVARGVPMAQISAPSSKEIDLTNREHCLMAVKGQDVVIHLAARVGGVGANNAHPGKFFYENALMGIQLMEAARLAGVKKFVVVGTTCSYPEAPEIPFQEKDLWNGYPTPVTAPYGLAKKMLLVQAQAYRQEYGFDALYLIPTNLYGPRDNFNPEYSHVIPALIRKVTEAVRNGDPSVEVWGTGSATRDFLYVKDAANAIVAATERVETADPINLGSGVETSIREVVDCLRRIVGFGGDIRWNAAKPDGQPRRCLDISRAKKEFGFDPQTGLEAGLKETIAWYHSQR